MNESAFKSGFDRGERGSGSAVGLLDIDAIIDSKQDREDREDGFKAGVLAAAIRERDDD
jgi:hypothetical protein